MENGHKIAIECPDDWYEKNIKLKGYRLHIAEECAEDCYTNHGLWLDRCPLDFHIFYESGIKLGVFTVEIKMVPLFSAVEKKEGI